MTELDKHAEKSHLKGIIKCGKADGSLSEYKSKVESGVKNTFGITNRQDFIAVKIALTENKSKVKMVRFRNKVLR